MESEKSLKLDDYGRPVLNSNQLIDLLYQGKDINHILVDKSDQDILLFEQHFKDLINTNIRFQTEETIDFDLFHEIRSKTWLIPEQYKKLDVEEWLLKKCITEDALSRVKKEYQMYLERDLINLLRFFIFLVDHFRKNKLFWGIGRGSSVSSYILYLIGIHRVDSLKYNLPIEEFLK